MRLTVVCGRLELAADDERPVRAYWTDETHDGAPALPSACPIQLWVGHCLTNLSVPDARAVIDALSTLVDVDDTAAGGRYTPQPVIL